VFDKVKENIYELISTVSYIENNKFLRSALVVLVDQVVDILNSNPEIEF